RGRRGVGRGGRWPATGPVPTVGGAGIARRHRRRKHAMIAHLVQSYGYYAVFALIAPESLGIPLPGESALIAAALYARTTHHLNTAAAAAVIGDNAGYWTSKTGGRGLAERYRHYVRLNRVRLKAARSCFVRYGVPVVFFGRCVAVLRTYAAFLAGLSTMRWSRFLVANAAGRRAVVGHVCLRRVRARQRRIEHRQHDHHRRLGGRRRADGGHHRDRAKVAAAPRATSRGRLPRPAGPLSRAGAPGSLIRPVLCELTAPNPLTPSTSERRQACPGRADGPDLRGMVTH